MEKIKLTKSRIEQGYSQQQMADFMNMDVSNYNRREKGLIKIQQHEWGKLAQFLKVPIEDIYEPDEAQCLIIKNNTFKDNSNNVANLGGSNHIYTIPQHILDTQRKYIEQLELEIEKLKREDKIK